jgi:hypothetical protein
MPEPLRTKGIAGRSPHLLLQVATRNPTAALDRIARGHAKNVFGALGDGWRDTCSSRQVVFENDFGTTIMPDGGFANRCFWSAGGALQLFE